MKFSFAIASEIGLRPANEDAISVWPDLSGRLAVAIADGLGGYQGGKQASDIAIRIFGNIVSENSGPDLHSLALSIHEEIRREQNENNAFRGMATTLSAAVISSEKIDFVHCGDTRIILQRYNGIRRLTVDHTEAQRLLDAGLITQSEYVSYPRKNVLESALGIAEEPRIDVGTHDIKVGDRIFFTSDGAHSRIMLRELRDISLRYNEPDALVECLMSEVNNRNPDDNYTVAAVFVDGM